MANADTVDTDFAAATADLANRVLTALDHPRDADSLTHHVESAADPKAALAAVRVLAGDALAAHVLAGAAVPEDDAATAVEAMRLFPLAPAVPGTDPDTARVAAWRDWGLLQIVTRQGGLSLDTPPRPAVESFAGGPADGDEAITWRPWCVQLAQLSPLALPGLDGPVHEAARRNTVPLVRGLTWAMLRRDFPLAARLGRWLALLTGQGLRMPVEAGPLLDHIQLFGAVESRTVLDVEIGRRLLHRREAPA
ncbi:hypothetical protein [Streptomyces sp. B6B3]|uniref:hypothetical protein n=1 Tax=Streptomyces sp. B6B3 TaxID=3153570 RepID=UPI00325D3E61